MTNAQQFCTTMNRAPDADHRALVIHLGGVSHEGRYDHVRFADNSIAVGVNGTDGEPMWIPLPSRGCETRVDEPLECDPITSELRCSLDSLIDEARRIITIALEYGTDSDDWKETARRWAKAAGMDDDENAE